jgi:hypothetical protein
MTEQTYTTGWSQKTRFFKLGEDDLDWGEPYLQQQETGRAGCRLHDSLVWN